MRYLSSVHAISNEYIFIMGTLCQHVGNISLFVMTHLSDEPYPSPAVNNGHYLRHHHRSLRWPPINTRVCPTQNTVKEVRYRI